MDSHRPFFTMIAQASQEHRFATILVEFALQMTGLLDQINKVKKKHDLELTLGEGIQKDSISGFLPTVSFASRPC